MASRVLKVFTRIIIIIVLAIISVCIIYIVGNSNRITSRDNSKNQSESPEAIFQALSFDFDRNIIDEKEIHKELSNLVDLLDPTTFESKDSLLIDFEKYINYEACLELYRDALNVYVPQSVRTYLLNKSLQLAKTKYETLYPILLYSKKNKEYDRIVDAYDLVKIWDKDTLNRDNHDYYDAITKCMEYAIMVLEDTYSPVNDSIAAIILKWSDVGVEASSQLFDDDYYHPITYYFADKRTVYAYKINDPNADRYADYHIDKTQRSPLFSSHYHYLISAMGGDIQGYQNGFFSDPIFLRYKSCLKQKQYDRARELLDLIQSPTTESYQDPVKPYYALHDAIQFDNRRLVEIALPYSQYDLATISENARLRYLTNKDDFNKWASGAYLTGAWYLSPTEGLTTRTIDYIFDETVIPVHDLTPYIAVNYNNKDPRWAYNTALYLKGASTKLSNSIEKAIKKDYRLVTELEEIKRERVFSSNLDTQSKRYGDFNEAVERLLGSNMKQVLADCFYSFEDIRRSLSDNECAIEIVKAPSLSFEDDIYKAVVLRRGWEEPKIVTLASSSDINKQLIAGNYYSTSSSTLYSTIWKPLEEYLSNNDIVYYASDGVLSLANISAFLNDRGERLSDRYNIHLCVSTKSVKDKEDESRYKTIALFGGMNYDDYSDQNLTEKSSDIIAYRSGDNSFRNDTFDILGGTEKEVNQIDVMANSRQVFSLLYSGAKGTEYNFKDLTGKHFDIIHVATHGFYYNAASTKDMTFFERIFVEDNPLNRCGLIFSGGNKAWKGEVIPDNQEDGILLGSEIARMDLSGTDLVVLSACNTGLGEISEEGVVGLQMAFKRAGVKSLLMTLSKVDDDATSFFMANFYEHLFSGEDKHSAYKSAINTMRNSERFSDPKYWSPFILVD
jgi:CHAT domain-containing protein